MKVLNFGSLNLDYIKWISWWPAARRKPASPALLRWQGTQPIHRPQPGRRSGFSRGQHRHKRDAPAMGTGECRGEHQLCADSGGCAYRPYLNPERQRRGDNCILLFCSANRCVTPEQVDEIFRGFSTGDWIILQNEINALGLIWTKLGRRG